MAIITQPPSERKRGRKLMPSPVAQHALHRGFPKDLIFTPDRAGEDGVKETGVSLAYTVRALDSGPIIASERVEVDDNIKAPELLSMLFDLEVPILYQSLIPYLVILESPFNIISLSSAAALPSATSPAVKSEESWLSFHEEASVLHNKVRAFSGWPGTRVKVQVCKDDGRVDVLELKVITTRVGRFNPVCDDEDGISFTRDALVIPCVGCSALEVVISSRPFSFAIISGLNSFLAPKLLTKRKKQGSCQPMPGLSIGPSGTRIDTINCSCKQLNHVYEIGLGLMGGPDYLEGKLMHAK
ncbi:hypothetical protein ACLOJK_032938 [Asimina triloba]